MNITLGDYTLGQVKRIFLASLLAGIVVFTITFITGNSQIKAESKSVASVDLIVYINKLRMEGDPPPHMYQNTTYVSVRDFAIHTNGLLYWNAEEQRMMIRYQDRKLVHDIGSQMIMVDDRRIEMSAASRIYEGRTFLPLRDMVNVVGGTIDYWNEENRTIVQIVLPHQIADEEKGRIDRYLRQQNFIGSALVARGDQIILEEGYGPSGNGDLNSSYERSRIASISKQFTAAAVLKLAEDGKLDLRDPLSMYIPHFPRGQHITVQMLLTHYAGLPSDYPRHKGDTLQETIERIKKQEFPHAPGLKYKYSNPGYVLLAEVIQKASGMTYGGYLQQTFFTPIGMRNTGEATEKTPTVKGFRVINGRYIEAPYYVSQSGTGSLYSTVHDLLKWDRALYTDKYLSRHSLAKLFPAGHKSYYVVGGGSGYSTILAREPENEITVILLSNEDHVDIHNLYLGVRKRLD